MRSPPVGSFFDSLYDPKIPIRQALNAHQMSAYRRAFEALDIPAHVAASGPVGCHEIRERCVSRSATKRHFEVCCKRTRCATASRFSRMSGPLCAGLQVAYRWGKQRCRTPNWMFRGECGSDCYFSFFGRPRGRIVDSKSNCRAIASTQVDSPKGTPRCTLQSNRSLSAPLKFMRTCEIQFPDLLTGHGDTVFPYKVVFCVQ